MKYQGSGYGNFQDSYGPMSMNVPNQGVQGLGAMMAPAVQPTPSNSGSDLDGFIVYICESNPQSVGAWLMQKGAYQADLASGVEQVLVQGTQKDMIDFINFHPDKDMLIELYEKRQINQNCGCKPGYTCPEHRWGLSKDTWFYVGLLLVLALGIYFLTRNN